MTDHIRTLPMLTIAATLASYCCFAQTISLQVSGSSPLSSSGTLVNIPLRAGIALQITATGQVNYDVKQATQNFVVGPQGGAEIWQPRVGSTICSGNACTGAIWGPRGALAGIFVADKNVGANTLANFSSATQNLSLQLPLTGQPFYIGDGKTPNGEYRRFVIPDGATRLYLGIIDDPVTDNSGAFSVNITAVDGQIVAANPLRVLATSQLSLAGVDPGTKFGNYTDFAPLNSPGIVDLSQMDTGTVAITAVGTVKLSVSAAAVTPNGTSSILGRSGTVPTGYSSISAPTGSLIGVFAKDQNDLTLKNNFISDFSTSTSRNVSTLSPLLQQMFFIGSGRTDSGAIKQFVIPKGATKLYLGINGGTSGSTFSNGDEVNNNSGSFFVTASPIGSQLVPGIGISGIVNGAGFGTAPLSAGSLAALFGQRLSSRSLSAQTVPLPIELAGSKVWFNDVPAPLFFVSADQINVQIPIELITSKEVQVVIANSRGPSTPVFLGLSLGAPGLFTAGDGSPVIVNSSSGRLVTPAEPAHSGDILILYASGLGPVSLTPATGVPAPLDKLSYTTSPVSVSIGGRIVTPDFSGLAPGFIGVYQVNVKVPSDLAPGPTSISVSVAGGTSNLGNTYITK